jgi:MFS family permease
MFAVDGFGFGTWAAHLPAFKTGLGLSDGELSVPLFAMVAGSLLAMPMAGRFISREGSRGVVLASACLYSFMLPLIALSVRAGWGMALFTLAALVFGAVKGALDVAANTQAVAALGFTTYMTAMTVARFVGDRLVATFGPARLLWTGGLLVAVGLGGAIASRTFPAALIGFGLVGMGLANTVPVLFRSAGKEHDAGGAIAAVSTLGYLGFLAGPPMIGVLSEALGLPSALLAVVAFGVMIALGARIALCGRESEVPADRREHDQADALHEVPAS